MPEMTGIEFLRRVKDIYPDTVRLVLSGYTDIDTIIQAINEGAIYKFLTKPWDDEALRQTLRDAFRQHNLAADNQRLSAELLAANRELEQVNARLQEALRDKEERVRRDETTLLVTQEMLQNLPWPMIGIDSEEMIAFANHAALSAAPSLCLGQTTAACLPAELVQALRQGRSEFDAELGGARYSVRVDAMGRASASRGSLLVFVPPGAAS